VSFSPAEIRSRSLLIASQAGIAIPSTLPLLDLDAQPRSQAAIVDRLLALHAVAAASYGFDKAKAIEWLKRERLTPAQAETERQFLEHTKGDPLAFRFQVEGMWALAWALNLVGTLNFWSECDDNFVALMPNLLKMEDATAVRAKASLRSRPELCAALDLAYCLHWAIRQAQLEGAEPPDGLTPDIVVERRRALEWLLSAEPWDAVSLDT
jgi:hypothetical protein